MKPVHSQEGDMELDMEQWTGSKLNKEYIKAVYYHPAYSASMQSTSWKSRLDEAQVGIKVARRNINNLRYAGDTTIMAESEELKSLLMKVKEVSEKVGWKLNIQENKIMASSPITSWQIDGETMETATDFILGAPKSPQMMTAAMKVKDTCSLEGKSWPT